MMLFIIQDLINTMDIKIDQLKILKIDKEQKTYLKLSKF